MREISDGMRRRDRMLAICGVGREQEGDNDKSCE